MNNPVLSIFEEITKIPRPSKHEEKMTAFLLSFAKEHNLESKSDEFGNVLIKAPATVGYENSETIVLQAHMDMVCEKNSNVEHDFLTQGIRTIVKDGWMCADGTTLGADDGIGVAAALAVITEKDVPHAPIECLFTVDEETGLTGAQNLHPGFFTGRTLLNLDSEDEGEIFIGCAGGLGTYATYAVDSEPISGNITLSLKVTGCQGGHSGGDIHLGRANAIKVLAHFLYTAVEKFGARLVNIDGGNLHNAIPREASAVFTVDFKYREDLRIELNHYIADVEDYYSDIEPTISINMQSVDNVAAAMSAKLSKNVVEALVACPNGVIDMSRVVEGLVETSTNLASIHTKEGKIDIVTSQRSSVESRKKAVAQMVASSFALSGADVTLGDGYPGWQPKSDSPILKHAVDAYQKLFGESARVKAIHAGLECGLFLDKYPGLDMISFGPTLRDVHSPAERLDLKSLDKFWLLLCELVK